MSIVKDMVKNYYGNINLKNTLARINNQIRVQSNPFIKGNLRKWAIKYRYKIKRGRIISEYGSVERYNKIKKLEGEIKDRGGIEELMKNNF